jgi:hypothetical protein
MATKRIPINPKHHATPAGPEQDKTVHYDPNQYSAPIGPSRPTAYQKIKQSVRDASKPVSSVAKDMYAAGAHARSVGHEIGNTPIMRSMRSQDGFSSQSPRQQPRGQQYPNEQYDTGESITLKICDAQGNCRTKKIKGGPKKPRQTGPSWNVGGLGSFGNDPGFG